MKLLRIIEGVFTPRIERVPSSGDGDTTQSYVVAPPHWPPILVSVVF
jgi:hypothetical protein